MYLSLFVGTCISILTCIAGDKICSLLVLQNRRADLLRAIVDNLTHGLVGGISWWLVIGFKQPKLSFFNSSRINQSLLCIFLSSAIDIDHFIAAGSLHIEDVTHLPHRPPLHCSGLTLLIFAALWLTARFYPGMHLLPWEWLVSFSSHHVRDATRRGLWLVPRLITTRPLPYRVYLAAIAAIPPLVALVVPLTQQVALESKTFVV